MLPLGSDRFTCEACGTTFTKGRADVEAMEEFRRDWPEDAQQDELAILCEECYSRLMILIDIAGGVEEVSRQFRDREGPRVCIAHGRFIPCRHGSESSPCQDSDQEADIRDVSAFQRGTFNNPKWALGND